MEKHVQLVGILNLVYRALMLVGSFVLFIIAFGFGYFISFISRYSHNDLNDVPPEILNIVPILLTCIGLMLFVVSVAGIIGSIGVMKHKEWGRIVIMVVSFFNLLHVPLGTILGVYSIWILFNDEVIRMFNPVAQKLSQ